MRRAALLVLLAVIFAGCGGTDDETPEACLNGPALFLNSQGSEVAVSECLAENQPGGELATVGAAMVTAATRLNGEARAEPEGDAAFRLGYLVGAATRGEERTEGIHADLLRRLEAAALYSPGGDRLPATFYRAYRSGYAAGQQNG